MESQRQHRLFDPEPEAELPEKMPWEVAAELDLQVAQIVFNRPLDTMYSYLVPDDMREQIRPGQRVKVPFGRGDKLTVGYCVGLEQPTDPNLELKTIHSILDREPLLSAHMLDLTRWIAERYLCAWGQVLDGVVPAGVKKKAGTKQVVYFRPAEHAKAEIESGKLAQKQKQILEILLESDHPMRADELARTAGCTIAPVQALRKKGLLKETRTRTETSEPENEPIVRTDDILMNLMQQKALGVILQQLRSGQHRTLLLHGVTGSGKTEVYIQAIREVVSYGRQAIVLVPEISLTPQTIRRFRARFDSVAVLHSHLSDVERHQHWQQIARGQVQVVVGARSAIFAPTPHLGIIIIDEEHETSFKQETIPRYHAREVARKRAEQEQIPLVLGSATPTLETWLAVSRSQRDPAKYPNGDLLISMPNRVEKLPLPPVIVVDIRNDPRIRKGEAIGRVLESSIRTALMDNGQVILFLNLRGYSPTLWCRACGEAVKCHSCDISLTWHKDRKVALCHFCDFEMPPVSICPSCQQPGILYFGTGTQKLEQEVLAKFPEALCLRMDSDSMRKPGSHDKALEAFRRGEVQILLGTQMIAKGLDFPNVTLVGVVDADTTLHQPDLRATERTFQLISQVAGRTGRSFRGGRVYVQTACPGEPAIVKASAHDYIGFAREELKHRYDMEMPPFRHLARVILRGPHEPRVQELADELASILRATAEELHLTVHILGPAPAPVAKLKDHYRWHLQLSAQEITTLHQLWKTAQEKFPRQKDVEYVVDVDAINMR